MPNLTEQLKGSPMITEGDIPKAEPTLMQVIYEAVQKGSGVEVMGVLERMWALQQQDNAVKAKREYKAAMSRVQGKIKAVFADLYNSQTKSNYPSYKALDDAVRPHYTAEGFELEFDTRPAEGDNVTVLCYISHSAGHEENRQITVPMPLAGPQGKAVMTRTHGTNAAVSYGQSKLLRMIFNIAVMGAKEDVDGNAEGMDADHLQEWLDAIDGVGNRAQLKETYFAAQKAAEGDRHAQGLLNNAKNAKYRSLAQ